MRHLEKIKSEKNIFLYFLSKKIIRFIFLLFIISSQNSCLNEPVEEQKHPLFIKAMNAKERADYYSAEKYLIDFIALKPQSGKAHLELAIIYHNHLDKPIEAVYHYRKVLEISPTSDTEEVRSLINASEKKIFFKLSEKFQNQQTKQLNILADENQKLISENKSLIKEIEYLKKNLPRQANIQAINEKIIQPDEPQNLKKKETDKPDIYIVEPGDTLSKIARKIYGNTKYYKLILEANKETLQKEDSPLFIGQKLILPKIPNE